MEDANAGLMTHERPQVPTGREVLEEVRALDDTTKKHLRERSQKQLYFTAKGLMRYKDVNPRTHGAFCRFIQDEEKDRRLALMPRGHLKSSIATEADCVRLGLDDPENARILIANEILGNSVAFLSTIKQQFEKNKLLQALFPELILTRFSGPGIQWSSEGATLPRSTTYKEPTWTPLGTGGAAVSKHFTRIKADDLIGLEAKKSPAKMKDAIGWNRNIESLAVSAFDTVIDWIGTRWGKNDLYGDVIQRYGARLAIFHRSVYDKDKNFIFPEKFNWEFFRTIMEETPDIWASQYLNDPLSDGTNDIDGSNLRTFRFDNEGNVVFKLRGVETKWHTSQLDRILTVDPNGGQPTSPDEAAIVVTGIAPDNNVFVLADYGGRPTPSGLVDKIFSMAMRWRPRVVIIEQAATANTLFYFREKCKDEQMYFLSKPGKHNNKNKDDRIRTAIEPVVATQRLFLLPTQVELNHQISEFGDLKNDDRIDALSYAPDEWRKPMAVEQQKRNSSAVKLMLAQRNPVTGYGGTGR